MRPSQEYVPLFVESFPTPMEPGVLYVSIPYATAGHICPCGCKREVVTKLSPARWRVTFDGEVSLWPSVAATGLPCNSHYYITRGRVSWHDELSSTEAAKARAADRRAIELNRSGARDDRSVVRSGWFDRMKRRLKKADPR